MILSQDPWANPLCVVRVFVGGAYSGAGGIDSVLHAQNIDEKGTKRVELLHLMILDDP